MAGDVFSRVGWEVSDEERAAEYFTEEADLDWAGPRFTRPARSE